MLNNFDCLSQFTELLLLLLLLITNIIWLIRNNPNIIGFITLLVHKFYDHFDYPMSVR